MDHDADLLAVVEFRYDATAPHGWSVRVEAASWMRTGAVGRLLREAADRYDPPAYVRSDPRAPGARIRARREAAT